MAVPKLLERFLARAGQVPQTAKRVVIEQRGEMRLQADGDWQPFTAEQWFAIDEVGFCWHARVKMAPLVTAVVEDAYELGEGRLDAKLWGALPVAHGEGPEFDRGEVQRYLAELPWNPAALLRNEELVFEEVDGNVRVWVGDPETYVDLLIDEATGDIVGARCDNRPFGDAGPTAWEGVFGEYREIGGLRVPTSGEVSWMLPDGPFTYWRGEVTELHFVTPL